MQKLIVFLVLKMQYEFFAFAVGFISALILVLIFAKGWGTDGY